MTTRIDPQGYTTKVTALADGFGCRILKGGQVIAQERAASKGEIASTIRDMLRMLDKCGNPSSMASASRDRG